MKHNRVFVVAFFVLAAATSRTNGNDEDENFYFVNNNNKFLLNSKNCPTNYYYDVDYFKCRLCDPNFNLVASDSRKIKIIVQKSIALL